MKSIMCLLSTTMKSFWYIFFNFDIRNKHHIPPRTNIHAEISIYKLLSYSHWIMSVCLNTSALHHKKNPLLLTSKYLIYRPTTLKFHHNALNHAQSIPQPLLHLYWWKAEQSWETLGTIVLYCSYDCDIKLLSDMTPPWFWIYQILSQQKIALWRRTLLKNSGLNLNWTNSHKSVFSLTLNLEMSAALFTSQWILSHSVWIGFAPSVVQAFVHARQVYHSYVWI